jgi:gas vesicle protein
VNLIRSTIKFAAGAGTGLVVGAIAGLMVAPESGDDLHLSFKERIRRAKLAGAQAKAAREEELIRKFRAGVNDPNALRDEEQKARVERDQAVSELSAPETTTR